RASPCSRPAGRAGCGGLGPARSAGSGLRRGAALLGLDAVLRAGLLAVADAGRVERAADHLVSEARQVLDATTAHEDDRVLLQVVALTGDVGADLHAVREPNSSDLAQRRVGLLRRRRVNPSAHA